MKGRTRTGDDANLALSGGEGGGEWGGGGGGGTGEETNIGVVFLLYLSLSHGDSMIYLSRSHLDGDLYTYPSGSLNIGVVFLL